MASLNKKSFAADLGLLYCAASWGLTFVVIKASLAGIDPITMVAYRFALAAALLLPFVLSSGRRIFDNIHIALPVGVVLWLIHMPQTLGINYTTASNAGFITGLFVLFIPVFMMSLFRHRPTLIEMLASAVAILGLWILTGGMRDINVGDVIVLVSAVTYALHVLLSDKYMKQGLDPLLFSCQQFMIVGAFSFAAVLVFDLPMAVSGRIAWLGVAFVAIVPTLSAFLIQMLAQRTARPIRVSLIFSTQPVFAAIFSWTVGGEEIVMHRAVGGLFIVAALLIAALSVSSETKKRRIETG